MITKKRLLISIFTHNRPDALAVNLMGLHQQTYDEFDILIIDDASEPRIDDNELVKVIVKGLINDDISVKFKYFKKNSGIATNRSLMLNELKQYDYVMDLNDDHFMERDCLMNMIRTLSRDDVCVVGSATPMFFWTKEESTRVYNGQVLNDIFMKDNQIQLKRGVDYLYFNEAGEQMIEPIEMPHVSQFMYKPEYLDELPMGYSILGFTEETDLALRLKKNSGRKLMFQPNAVNWHLQYKVGGIREISKKDHAAMIQSDWVLFCANWFDWVKINCGVRK